MNAASVKARLKNFATQNGITFQQALTYYSLERTIYRLSVSKYAEHFVLKGGIFLYALYQRNYARATTDIDFLARRVSNSGQEMRAIFRDILSRQLDDALVYDPDSVTVEDIAELKAYHGLRVCAVASLDRTRIAVSIDIGFGDVVYPAPVRMEFPVMLGMETPVVNAYSLESAVAEKLEAIVHNGYLNSRYKHFYDIYILSQNHAFRYDDLRGAVAETCRNRGTVMTMDAAAFGDDFLKDALHQTRWRAFLKKKKALQPVSLEDAMARIKTFVHPLLETGPRPESVRSPEDGCWR